MIRPPCKSCPWVTSNRAEDIPNFKLGLAERLAECQAGELHSPVFACHLSKPDEEFPCSGWLAVHGRESVQVRLACSMGQLDPGALDPQPGWPELHADYDEMMRKLRA